jgi:N,N'-diacetyllegionaminate synthase
MHLFGKSTTDDVIIIAEIGVNHEGDLEAARRLIRLAAEAGADAVKLQTYVPESLSSTEDAERFARISRFALSADNLRRLAREARDAGIRLFSSPASHDVVPLLDELFDAFKIASGDIDFEPLIRRVARTGKPVIVSTGCADISDIDRAMGWLADEIGREALAGRVALLHCVSAYPTPIEEANVLSVPFLAKRYGLATGFSNHVIGPEACYAAIAQGACLVEVHVTDRREDRAFRDHQLSFTPDELVALGPTLRRIRQALGQPTKAIQPCEDAARLAIRKGLVAGRALASGEVLAEADIAYARPATFYPAHRRGDLIGRKLIRALGKGASFRPTDFVE